MSFIGQSGTQLEKCGAPRDIFSRLHKGESLFKTFPFLAWNQPSINLTSLWHSKLIKINPFSRIRFQLRTLF